MRSFSIAVTDYSDVSEGPAQRPSHGEKIHSLSLQQFLSEFQMRTPPDCNDRQSNLLLEGFRKKYQEPFGQRLGLNRGDILKCRCPWYWSMPSTNLVSFFFYLFAAAAGFVIIFVRPFFS